DAGPGSRPHAAFASSNSRASSHRRRSTTRSRSSATCAGGPPNPTTPMRPHSRNTSTRPGRALTDRHHARPMALAVVIFLAALATIATERIHRTKVALLGAILMLLTQTIDQEHAIEAVDWNTIGLLAGMMLIVKLTE